MVWESHPQYIPARFQLLLTRTSNDSKDMSYLGARGSRAYDSVLVGIVDAKIPTDWAMGNKL